jgi:hypothetical protein
MLKEPSVLVLREKKKLRINTVIRYNVRKTQHQNPEFGHTQGEIQKKKKKVCKKVH